jgi:hypothetical protein
MKALEINWSVVVVYLWFNTLLAVLEKVVYLINSFGIPVCRVTPGRPLKKEINLYRKQEETEV